MSDLKLPEITPVGPVTSAAGALDRMGARLGQAGEDLSAFTTEMDKSRIMREQIDAKDLYLEKTKEALRTVHKQAAFSPDEVTKLFEGDVPPEVRLTDFEGKPRTYIPSHEVTGAYFERVSQKAKDEARSLVTGSGWKSRWDQHARELEMEARGAAMQVIDAQRAIDRRAWAMGKLDNYANSRNWLTYEAALKDPTFEISDAERQARLAELPTREVTSDFYQRLDTADPAELDALEASVKANKLATNRDPKTDVPLSVQDQQQFLTAIGQQRRAVAAGIKAKAEDDYKQMLGKAEAWLTSALASSGERAPATMGFTPAYIYNNFPGLKGEDRDRLTKTLLTAHQPDVEDTEKGIATFRAWESDGFHGVTLDKMMSLRGWVSRSRFDQYLSIFNESQRAGAKGLASTDHDRKLVTDWLEKVKGIKPGSQDYGTALDDALLALQQLKRGPGYDPTAVLTFRDIDLAVSKYKRADTNAQKGAVFKSQMTPEEKDAVLNLNRPEVKSAWEQAFTETHGRRPHNLVELQDYVAEALPTVEKLGEMVKTMDRGAPTPEHIALVYSTAQTKGAEIAVELGDKATDDAILQRAVDMNAMKGSEAKKQAAAQETASKVQGEQARAAVQTGKAQEKAYAEGEKAARLAVARSKPAWVIEADSIFSTRREKAVGAVPHPREVIQPPSSGIRFGAPPNPSYDPQEMKRYERDRAVEAARVDAQEMAAREAYTMYLRRHNYDPTEQYVYRGDVLPFTSYFAKWEKGEAPQ